MSHDIRTFQPVTFISLITGNPAKSFFTYAFQSGVRRNGQVVQGYPPIIEAHGLDEEKGNDEGTSGSLSTERNRTLNLRDADGISPLIRDSEKATTTAGQSCGRSGRKMQNFSLAALDASNLSPR